MNNTYQTTDLFLATTLSLFFPIDFIEKSNPKKSVFNFKRESSIDDFIEKYWRGDLSVEPKRLFNQLRTVKSRLYEQ